MKNERLRNAFGHAAGFALFVLAVPALMRRVSGRPCPNPGTGALRVAPAAALMLAGLALAIWAIVELRVAGKGNPFRPLDRQIATGSRKLLTAGPYALCRNPMAAGTHLYYLGTLLLLASPRRRPSRFAPKNAGSFAISEASTKPTGPRPPPSCPMASSRGGAASRYGRRRCPVRQAGNREPPASVPRRQVG